MRIVSSQETNELIEERSPDDQIAFTRIKEEIETKAKADYDRLLETAKKESKQIISAAQDKATKVKNEIINNATREAENIKIRELSRKKLSLKMDYLETREQIFNQVHHEVKSNIQDFTQSENYKQFLEKLLIESSLSIGGGSLFLQLRKEDKTLFTKDMLKQVEDKITKATTNETSIKLSKENLNSMGGLKIIREDTRLFVDNTFESRIERFSDAIRVELLNLLS